MARALRVPAGVTVGGRSIGGRFTSAAGLARLLARTDDVGRELIQRTAEREGAKAERAVRRLSGKFHDDPRRYAKAAGRADAALFAWTDVLDQLGTLSAGESVEEALDSELATLPPGDVRAIDDAIIRAAEADAAISAPPVGPVAVEWEIALDYKAMKRGKRAVSSDFDISLRIRRTDGAPMSHEEAKHVLFQFRASLMDTGATVIPHGYLLAAINWRRPTSTATGWRRGTVRDLEAFADPLNAWADAARSWRLRMGAVE